MYVTARPRDRVALGHLSASKAGEIQAGTVLTYTATGAAAGAVAGPYGAAAGAILGAAWGITQGLMGASKAWRTFAKRLAAGIQRQTADIQILINSVKTATKDADIAAAIAQFNAPLNAMMARGGRVTQQSVGPYDPHTPPGATGTKHEGGIKVDFSPVMNQIRESIRLKRYSWSPEGKAEAAKVAAEAKRPFLASSVLGMPLWLWFGASGVAFVASMFYGGPKRR